MKNKISEFKSGDKVRVSSGVKDPDFGIKIEGWSGKIEEVVSLKNGLCAYHIVLDKDTLSILSDDYISRCENENFRYDYLFLKEKELELLDYNGGKKAGVFIA